MCRSLSANSHTYYYLVFHHPLTLSFQAENLPFLQILPTAALPFSSSGFPRQFTVISEHRPICFLRLVFLFLHFLVVGSVRQIKLTHVGFRAHVKIASRIKKLLTHSFQLVHIYLSVHSVS